MPTPNTKTAIAQSGLIPLLGEPVPQWREAGVGSGVCKNIILNDPKEKNNTIQPKAEAFGKSITKKHDLIGSIVVEQNKTEEGAGV